MTDSTALSKRGLSASAKKQVRRAGAVLAALLALVVISSSHLKAQAALRVLGPVDTSIGGVHKWPMGVIDETGVIYDLLADRWRLSSDMDVNYMVVAEQM